MHEIYDTYLLLSVYKYVNLFCIYYTYAYYFTNIYIEMHEEILEIIYAIWIMMPVDKTKDTIGSHI